MAQVISNEEAVVRIAAVDAVGGNVRAAARELGIHHATLLSNLAVIKREYGLEPAPRLVIKGQSVLRNGRGDVTARWDKTRMAGRESEDCTHLPDPKAITKISTLYDQQGKVSQQWVSEKPADIAKEQAWHAFAAALAADLPRVAPVTLTNAQLSTDLCAVYPVGDHHLGMYSWAPETGGDYDLEIAERLLAQSMDYLVAALPPCEMALIAIIGDYLHYDSTRAETPLHKNMLDADGRAQKMVAVAVRSIRRLVHAALARHGDVRLILEPGNHDPHTITILQVCLAAMYENEPRLSVDLSPAHFHYFEFGANLVGTHHGHGVKMEQLPGIMANDQAEAWGRTKHRHFFTGHIHHKRHHDFPGCSVESLRILPPVDAYAAQHGYRAPRGMIAVTLHRRYGEVARYTVNPSIFEVAA